MPGYQTSKVFRLAGSLEAAAEKPSHRTKSAERLWFKLNISKMLNFSPGEGTDDQTVEHKGRGGSHVEGRGLAGLDHQVTHRAGDVAELLQKVGVHRSQQDRHNPSAQVSLHSLLRTENYERCGPKKESTHVGGDVVDGDDGHWEDVPDHAVLDGEVEEVARHHQEECCEVGPGQKAVAREAVSLVPDGEDKPSDQQEVETETESLPSPLTEG